MLITLDPSAHTPLFEQLTEELRSQISKGDLKAGQRLPSAQALAKSLELNVHTVLRSYQQLRDEGLIVMRPGRGTQVIGQPEVYSEIHHLLAQAVQLAKAAKIKAPTLITSIKDLYS